MNALALTQLLSRMAKDHGKRIFFLREMAALSGEAEPAVGMALIRAQKNEIVSRVKDIWINMADKPSLDEVAFALRCPSYISFESALYRQGILSQSPRGALTVATTGRPEEMDTPLGAIAFFHLTKKVFFGFDADRLAFPEKALLDLIYLRIRKGAFEGLSEVLYTDLLKKKLLREFAERFPPYVKKALGTVIT